MALSVWFLLCELCLRGICYGPVQGWRNHWGTEVCASPKFGLVRDAAERALPVFATPFQYIPVYVVTYDVIFRSVNWRNIITDEVNVGIFSCDAVFFCSEIRVTRWLLWHSDFIKFNYCWESLRHSTRPPNRLGRGTPRRLQSSSLSKIWLESLLFCLLCFVAA